MASGKKNANIYPQKGGLKKQVVKQLRMSIVSLHNSQVEKSLIKIFFQAIFIYFFATFFKFYLLKCTF